MKRTYIDANIMIAAFSSLGRISLTAVEVLDDPNRQLIVSDFLSAGSAALADSHKRAEEVEFMKCYSRECSGKCAL
jgi:hypothetical protein